MRGAPRKQKELAQASAPCHAPSMTKTKPAAVADSSPVSSRDDFGLDDLVSAVEVALGQGRTLAELADAIRSICLPHSVVEVHATVDDFRASRSRSTILPLAGEK